MNTTVTIGDTHVPYQDKSAIKCAIKIIKSIEPDNIIFIGDIIDFYSISRFSKTPDRINSLQDDLDETKEV